MPFQFTLFNLLTIAIIFITIVMIRARLMGHMDQSSVPLLYYFFLVIYIRGYEGLYERNMVLLGIGAALFLRFEFLGGFFLKFVKAAEMLALFYVILHASAYLLGIVRP
jgi:hypothetical protein